MIKYVLLVAFLLINSTAQAVPQIEPPCPDDDCQAPELPIDGGIIFLIIAGVAYGVYQKKQK